MMSFLKFFEVDFRLNVFLASFCFLVSSFCVGIRFEEFLKFSFLGKSSFLGIAFVYDVGNSFYSFLTLIF